MPKTSDSSEDSHDGAEVPAFSHVRSEVVQACCAVYLIISTPPPATEDQYTADRLGAASHITFLGKSSEQWGKAEREDEVITTRSSRAEPRGPGGN